MRAAVIEHVQPVADVAAVTVERHREVVDQVGDEQREDLFGKLVRPVVVRGARDNHRNVVSRPVAVGETIGARLAGRVGIARAQFVGLDARSLSHAAVDLVGGNLHEARERGIAPCRFEQHERAFDVGLDEVARRHDRSIDVRLGGKMDDVIRGFDQRAGRRSIENVAMHERVPRVVHHVVQVFPAAGISQLVEIGDVPVRMRVQRVAHEVAADKTGAAGDQDVYLCHLRLLRPTTESRPLSCRPA